MFALVVRGLIRSVAAVALHPGAEKRGAPRCRSMRCADKQGGASGRRLAIRGRGWVSKSPSLGDVVDGYAGAEERWFGQLFGREFVREAH